MTSNRTPTLGNGHDRAPIDTPASAEDALALVGNGYLVLPVDAAQRACLLLGVAPEVDAPGLPIVSWRDGDEAWEKCGLAGREGPGEGVESLALSYYVAARLGIDPAPGSAFAPRLNAGKQAAANMGAIRGTMLARGVPGPAANADRLIPTGWGTFPLYDEMSIGAERTAAELDYLLERGFFADHKLRSSSRASILTYRSMWKGRVENHPAFSKYAIAEHDTETRTRETLAIRDAFGQLCAEFGIDLGCWYWIAEAGPG